VQARKWDGQVPIGQSNQKFPGSSSASPERLPPRACSPHHESSVHLRVFDIGQPRAKPDILTSAHAAKRETNLFEIKERLNPRFGL